MNKKMTSNRWLIYGSLIVILLLLLSAYMIFVTPLSDRIEERQTMLDNAKKELEQVMEETTWANDEQDAAVLPALLSALPVQADMQQIIRSLEDEAEQFNLSVEQMTFSEQKVEANPESGAEWLEMFQALLKGNKEESSTAENLPVSKVTINLRFTAGEEEFLKFLASMQHLLRIIRVDQFEYTQHVEDDVAQVVGSVRLTAFYAEQFHSFIQE